MNRRIVFVNRYFFPDHSATSQMVSDLAFHLAGRGYSVTVVTSRQRYDAPDAHLDAAETVDSVKIRRVWTSRFGRRFLPGRAIDYLTFYLSTAWCLYRMTGPGDLVVAKTDPPLISVVAGWVVRLRGARLVNWLQDLFPEVAAGLGIGAAKGAVGGFIARLRDRSLRHAVMNVAIGAGMGRRLMGLGVTKDRVSVVHNWSDEVRIQPLSDASNPLRREWALRGKFVVGYSGNLGRAHEYDTILDAAARLQSHEDIVFLFIGGGAAMDGLRADAKKRGIGNLMFRPYQPAERLNESLSLPDVHLVVLRPEMEGLIVPSKFYGIGAVGRPTIFVGSLEGEIAKVLSDGDAGLSVETGNSSALASAVVRLRDDPDLRRRLGQNARKLSETRFSRQTALESWERVLATARQ